VLEEFDHVATLMPVIESHRESLERTAEGVPLVAAPAERTRRPSRSQTWERTRTPPAGRTAGVAR